MIGYFRHIVSLSDPEVTNGKPAPDVFLVAKNRFKHGPSIDPQSCLVFEDSVNGIKATTKAKMRSVFVPDPKMPLEIALNAEPTVTVRSLHDFIPEMFGLPAYDYKKVTHVLFDVDGLLLDTGKIFRKATDEILANYDKEMEWEQRVELMGKRREDMIDDLIEILDLPMTTEELNEEYSR